MGRGTGSGSCQMVGFSRHRTATGVELSGSVAREREFY
jgi:hypothetical protein